MKNQIRWVSVPETGICGDGMVSCGGREKNDGINIAKMAAIIAGILFTMEITAPLHTKYTEPDLPDYSINEIPEAKVSMDINPDMMLHSKLFAKGKGTVSLLEAKAKVEEWKENTEIPVLTKRTVLEPVVEITAEEAAAEERYESTADVWTPETDILKETVIVHENEGIKESTVDIVIPGSDDAERLPEDIILPGKDDTGEPVGDVIMPGKDDPEELPKDIIVPESDPVENISDIVLPENDAAEENRTEDSALPEAGDAAEDAVTPGDGNTEDNTVADEPTADKPADGGTITEDGGITEEIPETPAAPMGFLIDGEGMICGIDAAVSVVTDGYLTLPSEGCVGIRSGALADIGTGIAEVYIPANISVIEEGAFSGLHSLGWIEAAKENPGCMSIDGVLFDRSGTMLLAFPGGRMDMYAVPAEVTRIASGAFTDTAISRLDFWQCGMVELGENIFGSHNGNGIEVRVPEENIEWYQEAFAGYDVLIL